MFLYHHKNKFLLIILLLSGLLVAATLRMEILALKGLNTTSDPVGLDPSFSTELLNLTRYNVAEDLHERRGLYHRSSFNQNTEFNKRTRWVFPYSGYYTNNKMLVGVTNDSTELTHDTTCGTYATSGMSLTDTMSGYSKFTYSENLMQVETEIEHLKLFGRSHFNYCYFDDQLIIVDGSNVPYSFTDKSIMLDDEYQDINRNYTWVKRAIVGIFETISNEANALPIGLTAPGELAIQLFDLNNNSGDTNSFEEGSYYRYTYCYIRGDVAGGNATNTGWSPLSRPVFVPKNKYVLLSGFESSPVEDWIRDADTILINRMEYHKGEPSVTESQSLNTVQNCLPGYLIMQDTGYFYVADTGLTITSASTYVAAPSLNYSYRPGSFNYDNSYSREGLKSEWGAQVELLDTTEDYWFAYSYYDPIRNIESELGPYYKLLSTAIGSDADSIPVLVKQKSRSRTKGANIRIYRSKADDSMFMYGLVEVGANSLNYNSGWRGWSDPWNYDPEPSDSNQGLRFPPYYMDDDRIGTGDFYDTLTKLDNQREWVTYQTGINIVMVYFKTTFGNPIIRPPYERGCHYQFTDIVTFGSRLYGIGDPEFPQRVYYSDFDSLDNWSAFNYYDLTYGNTQDYLMAIENLSVQGEEFIVCFKQNSIYVLYGDDPEYSFKSARLKSPVGLLNERAYVEKNGIIYFIGSDYNVYAIQGIGQVVEISTAISASLDTFFSLHDETYAKSTVSGKDTSSFVTQVSDHILIGNIDTSLYYAYNYDLKSWHKFRYGISNPPEYSFLTPRYSFIYDTLSRTSGFTAPTYTLYDTEGKLMFEYDRLGVDVVKEGTTDSVGYSEKIYRSPAYGDGEHMYGLSAVDLDITVDNPTRSGNDSDFVRVIIKDIEGNGIDTARHCLNNYDNDRHRVKLGFKNIASENIMVEVSTYRYLDADSVSAIHFPEKMTIHSLEPHLTKLGRIAPEND